MSEEGACIYGTPGVHNNFPSMALPVLTKEKILDLNSSPPFDVTVTKIKVDYVTQ